MKKFLVGLTLLIGLAAQAQVFNNEWIDYTKTYYKFRVGKDGVCRINGATLAAAGLNTATAENLQLWRNGAQVPLFTSVASGSLSASDYIEFWGRMNDGKPDKELYREPSFQRNDKWSLISDSATYFLTVNPAGPNLRLQTVANDVATNTLPAEPYFIYTAGQYFKSKINNGFFYDVSGEHLYSSSYDKNEGWTSPDIETTIELNKPPVYGTLTTNYFSNLNAASTGPAPILKFSVGGNAYVFRYYRVTLNGDSVLGGIVPYLDTVQHEATFNLSKLASGNASLAITNVSDMCTFAPCVGIDRLVIHKIEMTYPRLFNFGGEINFEFSLPASAAGNYLEITNFAHGGVAPVLYDFTNGKRYVGELSGPVVKFVLQPSASTRNLLLANQAPANIAPIATLQSRTFINYGAPAAQGNYLIVSNASLFNGANGTNPVEDYRAYRASLLGGSHIAKIYLEDQLIDQFGFGIKKNPAGIRNFVRYARLKFATPPKQLLIIGRGVHYLHQRSVDATATALQKENLEKLNLVPTFGWPASDMLLTADPGTSTPGLPVGRITAITPGEVSTYLKKVKDLEQAQQTLSPAIGDKAWMKNVAHIAGAGEEPLASTLIGNLNNYKRIIEDTLYGAKVTTFAKTSSSLVQTLSDADLINLFNQGISLITYYGHSSATTLEFNLDEPANYNNQGKYPMFFALGCNAGNTFDYNESRFSQRNYLSDKYVLAPERGSINFVASTHFGIVHYLDIWNIRAYSNMARDQYRSSIGEVMKKTVEDVYGLLSADDFLARSNAEQTILNGDPAVRLNQQSKPDYVITDTMVKVAPNFISVADQFFKVNVSLMNLGRATSRLIVVETKRQFPDGSVAVIRRDTISGTRYRDTLAFNIAIDPTKDKGTNRIYVTVDADNAVDELFESNNSTFREFFIFEDEARTVYPYNYAIVNNRNITLKASTANPFSGSKQYRMEIDTTEAFNSPLKAGANLTSAGGIIEFAPGISFTDSTVYYWRVAPVPVSGVPTWSTASFVYLSNSAFGFNQSHYFQHKKSTFEMLDYAPGDKWRYKDKVNNLLIRSGVFVTAVTQAAEFAIAVNGANYIRSICAWPSLVVNVFDQNSFRPWFNANPGSP
ncbi:MAG TPA: C25 family cysteine peptidase, partial [Flavisolibacter sp.]|nr:C25 family cysteine peptidase [Flavisolibacter sp.]